MIPILLVVTATFRPPAPTVGDLITINFQQRVTLNKSPQYEIVSQRGSRAVIRTFEPRPFTISGDQLRYTATASTGGTAELVWKRAK